MSDPRNGVTSRRAMLSGALAGAGLASAASSARAQSAEESTYERIFRTKTIRVGLRPGDLPNFAKDLATQKWIGACIDLVNDMAASFGGLKVELIEEAAATNNILSLQTGKIDLTFGLSPTPQRALAIDFTSSLFDHPFGIVAKPQFVADSWAALNKPSINIAVNIGTSEEQAARAFAPNAKISGFKTRDEVLLALASGRADCGVFAALLGLVAAKRNAAIGQFRLIHHPRVSLPSCMGVPKERDARWRELINYSLLYYRGIGQIELWFASALEKQGVSKAEIPEGVFSG